MLSDTIPLNTTFVNASLPHLLSGSTVQWDFASLAPLVSKTVTLTVQAPFEHLLLTNSFYGARSDQVPFTIGLPVQVFVGYFLRFPYIEY